jgi:hypothetical protein
MAKANEQGFKSREAIRKGFLAYIGLYGAAYSNARNFVNGKGTDLFNDFVKKGEEVESRVQEAYSDFRSNAEQKYAEQLKNVEDFFSRVSNDVAETEEKAPAAARKGPGRKRVASSEAAEVVEVAEAA